METHADLIDGILVPVVFVLFLIAIFGKSENKEDLRCSKKCSPSKYAMIEDRCYCDNIYGYILKE